MLKYLKREKQRRRTYSESAAVPDNNVSDPTTAGLSFSDLVKRWDFYFDINSFSVVSREMILHTISREAYET